MLASIVTVLLKLKVLSVALTSMAQLAANRIILHSERSLVRFRSGLKPRLRVQAPGGAHARGNQSMFLPHIDISSSLFLPPFPPPWNHKQRKIFNSVN